MQSESITGALLPVMGAAWHSGAYRIWLRVSFVGLEWILVDSQLQNTCLRRIEKFCVQRCLHLKGAV